MAIEPFKLERYFSEYEFTTEYQLCNSDCEAMTIGDLLSLESGAQNRFNNLWLGYTETPGSPTLRQAISKVYHNISANEIMSYTGAQEPIYLFSQVMLNASDEVIVQFPCYQSVHSIPESIGCKVSKWNVRYDGARPTYDIAELAELITPKTKVIYINTPHNPTGYHFSAEEQKAVVALARKHGILIYSDEVYREL